MGGGGRSRSSSPVGFLPPTFHSRETNITFPKLGAGAALSSSTARRSRWPPGRASGRAGGQLSAAFLTPKVSFIGNVHLSLRSLLLWSEAPSGVSLGRRHRSEVGGSWLRAVCPSTGGAPASREAPPSGPGFF